jgi:NitT/TauT family transport system substrate-binding protein
LAGVHVGCYELFAPEPIRTISDLKGRRVGIPQAPGSSGHMLLAVMAAQIGLDPHADIDWITTPTGDLLEVFAERKVDAFLGFPPEPQELRARRIGRVILNTATDKPWSQYFCCIAFGHRDFVRASGRDQALPAGHPQARRPLRHRAGMGGATAGRCRFRRTL